MIDETRDGKRLFAELKQRLSCSWELMYAEAKKYYKLNGNLNVPRHIKPRVVAISTSGSLNSSADRIERQQIAALNDIGMKWRNTSQIRV